MEDNIPYTYTFVRTDISNAAAIVQSCHACLEIGLKLPEEKKPSRTSFLVLLQAKSEEKLVDIQEFLSEQNIVTSLFFEPDNNLGYTALATEPIYGDRRKLFKKFKLWS